MRRTDASADPRRAHRLKTTASPASTTACRLSRPDILRPANVAVMTKRLQDRDATDGFGAAQLTTRGLSHRRHTIALRSLGGHWWIEGHISGHGPSSEEIRSLLKCTCESGLSATR